MAPSWLPSVLDFIIGLISTTCWEDPASMKTSQVSFPLLLSNFLTWYWFLCHWDRLFSTISSDMMLNGHQLLCSVLQSSTYVSPWMILLTSSTSKTFTWRKRPIAQLNTNSRTTITLSIQCIPRSILMRIQNQEGYTKSQS